MSADDANAYTPREATGHIKALYRVTDELKTDIRGLAAELSKQALTLSEIRSDTRQIAQALSNTPNRCVENTMRLQRLEESNEDLSERLDDVTKRGPCSGGCKNDDRVDSLVEFKRTWEPRLWMGIGGLALLQILIGLAVKWMH